MNENYLIEKLQAELRRLKQQRDEYCKNKLKNQAKEIFTKIQELHDKGVIDVESVDYEELKESYL